MLLQIIISFVLVLNCIHSRKVSSRYGRVYGLRSLQRCKRFKGEVLLQGDDGYEEARLAKNGVGIFNHQSPLALVYPTNERDVQLILKRVQRLKLKFRVRNGGHHLGGFSNCNDCVVIELDNLNSYSFNDDKSVLTAGAGLLMGDIRDLMQEHDIYLPSPISGDIGLSGYSLASGWSSVSHTVGVIADYIIGATIVLHDGTIMELDENDELLFGLRGSGPQQFGIVTEWKFRTIPYKQFVFGKLTYVTPVDLNFAIAPISLLQAYREYYIAMQNSPQGIPIELQSDVNQLGLMNFTTNEMGLFTIIDVVWYPALDCLTETCIQQSLAFGQQFLQTQFVDFFKNFMLSNFGILPIEEEVLVTDWVDYVPRTATFGVTGDIVAGFYQPARYVYNFEDLTDQFITQLVNYLITSNQQILPLGMLSTMVFEFNGGMVYLGDPDNDYTSHSSRDNLINVLFTIIYSTNTPFETVAKPVLDDNLFNFILPILDLLGPNVQMSKANDYQTDLLAYYYTQTYPDGTINQNHVKIWQAINELKCEYDPDNVFGYEMHLPGCDA